MLTPWFYQSCEQADMPPSTRMVCPLTYRPRSEQRKAHADAMSEGAPPTPAGTARWKAWARKADKCHGGARLRNFAAEEATAPLQGIERPDGTVTVDPREVAAQCKDVWSELWRAEATEEEELR